MGIETMQKKENKDTSSTDLLQSAQEHAGIEGDTLSPLEGIALKLRDVERDTRAYLATIDKTKLADLDTYIDIINRDGSISLDDVPERLQKDVEKLNTFQSTFDDLQKKAVIYKRLAEMEAEGVSDDKKRDMVDTQIKKNAINNQLENISGVTDEERKENIKQRLNEIKDEATLKTMED